MSAEVTHKRARRSRSGRIRNRSAQPGHNPHLEVPFITRKIKPYEILEEDQLDQIEVTSERIMEEIGIEFRDDPEVVELFRERGVRVKKAPKTVGTEAWRLRFEPGLVRDILSAAPERFTQHARNPKNTIEVGTDATVFLPSYGSPFILEMDGTRRYATLEDFENLVKLAQSSPWLHYSGGTICEPTDIPVNKRHLDMVYAHMRYSDRPFQGSITAPERAADSIEMCRILFGAEFVDKNCVITGNFNTTSPLVIDGVTSQGIRTYARAGQGTIHLPFLLGGAVAPLTMAGQVAQNLAETLVSASISQLERPGAPAVIASFMNSLAMRSGSPTFGTPEPAAASLIMGQFARRYRLPLRCAGSFTTSKLPDGQAMQQSMMSALSAVQSGANFIMHMAGYLDGLLSMSYEKMMMDLDVCGALHAYLQGVEVNEDTLGFDALAEGGPGEHMFGSQHTLRHYETAYWDCELDDNTPWETWDENGRIDMATRANKKWKAQLAHYKPPAMDAATDAALKAFIQQKRNEMPDLWH
ncbi:trimethylamine methyltransferase family protein [Pseudopelagicola sp. nBUS_19]|uniref:trimethylamine methyltransferase family protein n=1 Tax=unclassified Pseudopelagicola TaxID=2649563 RepID=UPI003EBBE081